MQATKNIIKFIYSTYQIRLDYLLVKLFSLRL